MKNRRSLLVNWTRPRTLRCSTITWCLRAAFSASSRLLGLKGEATRLKTKNISATIVADDKRFYHRIKRTTFSAHTPGTMRRKRVENGSNIEKSHRASGSRSRIRGSGEKRRLANFSRRCLSRGRTMCGDRQLQHRRGLARAKAREQHYLPVREFQRVVMGHGVVHVDLPEAREPLPDLVVWQNTDAVRGLAFDILVERDFGARQQADRNIRLADRREPSRDGIGEFGRHQLVLDPGRPGRDMVSSGLERSAGRSAARWPVSFVRPA